MKRQPIDAITLTALGMAAAGLIILGTAITIIIQIS